MIEVRAGLEVTASIRLDFLVPYFYEKRKKKWYQKTPWPTGYGSRPTNRHALVG